MRNPEPHHGQWELRLLRTGPRRHCTGCIQRAQACRRLHSNQVLQAEAMLALRLCSSLLLLPPHSGDTEVGVGVVTSPALGSPDTGTLTLPAGLSPQRLLHPKASPCSPHTGLCLPIPTPINSHLLREETADRCAGRVMVLWPSSHLGTSGVSDFLTQLPGRLPQEASLDALAQGE